MKLKKILSLVLIATMLLSMTVTPVFAANPPCDNRGLGTCVGGDLATAVSFEGGLCQACLDAQSTDHNASATPNSTENVGTEDFTDHIDGSEAVEVNATVASTYSVTIPKTITMSGANKSADYTVSVSGDIADNETVKVAPDASFLMNTAKGDKAAVTATITQDKSTWAWDEFATQASGNISAPLTAGVWSGSFNFAITLETATAAPEVELISFTIDGVPHQAGEGMTWGDWIDTEYNVNHFRSDGNNVFMDAYYIEDSSTGNMVQITDVITNTNSYAICSIPEFVEMVDDDGKGYIATSSGGARIETSAYILGLDEEIGGNYSDVEEDLIVSDSNTLSQLVDEIQRSELVDTFPELPDDSTYFATLFLIQTYGSAADDMEWISSEEEELTIYLQKLNYNEANADRLYIRYVDDETWEPLPVVVQENGTYEITFIPRGTSVVFALLKEQI